MSVVAPQRRLRTELPTAIVTGPAVVTMTAGEVGRLVEKACRRKQPMSCEAARRIAQSHRDAGEPYSAYRCPFADDPADHHWHVGHTVSIEGLAAIALAIRQRFQESE